jgi:antitoxin component of RelBE/YafQ-DinJ toxin-antitoxin module
VSLSGLVNNGIGNVSIETRIKDRKLEIGGEMILVYHYSYDWQAGLSYAYFERSLIDMSTCTIRLDEGVREETTRIASEMGLTFNAVMNILARKFNAEKGFPFPVRLETAQKTVFDMSSDEFEAACQEAVAQRTDVSTIDYATRFDKESGMITKIYTDGRVEYVLD